MAVGGVAIHKAEPVNRVTTLSIPTATTIQSLASDRAVAEVELILKRLSYYARLNRILAYLQNDIAAPISLGQAAGMACMERTSFSRFFKRVVGITFREFMQRWRIAIALDQISASDHSITEIAFASGFDSMSAFERTFKKVTALSPSEYRRRLLAHAFATVQPIIADSQPNSAYK